MHQSMPTRQGAHFCEDLSIILSKSQHHRKISGGVMKPPKRENLISDSDKEKLVDLLKDINLLPVRQGEVSIHISPERKISGVKVTSLLS